MARVPRVVAVAVPVVRTGGRRALVIVVAAVLAAVLGGSLPARARAGAAAPPQLSAAAVGAMFERYGDAGGHWTGGDGSTSVALPDGRVAWLFSDTFLGTVNPDGSRPPSTPLINNSIVVQSGNILGPTLHGGSPTAPRALVQARQAGEFLWVADGIVEGAALKVLYNRFRSGSGTLDLTMTGTSLVTFDLPSLRQRSTLDLPYGTGITWGSGITPVGAHTYVYGTSVSGRLKFAHVARVPAGRLEAPWEFWTGTAWSADRGRAARLLSGVGTTFSVQPHGDGYLLVTQEANLVFDRRFVAYTAATPTGPFTGPTYLFTAPEPQPGTAKVVYDARLHPEIARPGALLMSYNVNSLTYADNLADARLYRPRFVELSLPSPDPGTAVPGAPTDLAVTTQQDFADLTWSAVPDAVSYQAYLRDVTGGQTHAARQDATVPWPSSRVGWLTPGHRYEFQVRAVNRAGHEGPPSATVTAVAPTAGAGPALCAAATGAASPVAARSCRAGGAA